jgi:CspA family cold shock protein
MERTIKKEVKKMEENKALVKGKGIIKTIHHDRGFGFIRQDDGTEIFFHASGVCNPPKLEDLREGYEVKYIIVEAPKGKKAIGITKI